ncbi:MAG: nucleotide sugar dehydrogenase [Patescibacteria group bacterium]
MEHSPRYDLCIIGGAGHVGLPLAVSFANTGVSTVIFDIDENALEIVKKGNFPFKEEGGDEALRQALKSGKLTASIDPTVIRDSRFLISVIGTPIDEHLNPDFGGINRLIETYLPYFRNGHILILRSTVYPGTTKNIQSRFRERGLDVRLAFCPERIVQGKALIELRTQPQILSAFDDETYNAVRDLFQRLTEKKIFRVDLMEAELAKLFSNAWRYITFAVANQFYMIAEENGLDYKKIDYAMRKDYPRNTNMPTPGFAAGPCLFKDTMQLSAFARNSFFLGHSAMLVNEGLPQFIIEQLKQISNLSKKTIGILGMAFKANNDDSRASLSFKLKKIAEMECKNVLCHDVYISNSQFSTIDEILQRADIIILATPHDEYLTIDPKKYPGKTFIDIWSVLPTSKET